MPNRRYDFSTNPDLQVNRTTVEPEHEPVLYIDDVLRSPHDMIEFARRDVSFEPAWTPNGGYPGVRANAPLSYVECLAKAISPVIQRAFGLHGASLARAECYLSMVTRRPETLAPLQCIPHIDTTDSGRIALLHFFCDSSYGGTAFYRHRSTKQALIDAQSESVYLMARDSELVRETPAAAYISGDTDSYEQTAVFAARFNRLLVYRSCHLHSGLIPDAMEFSSDPAAGRLTANVFLIYN